MIKINSAVRTNNVKIINFSGTARNVTSSITQDSVNLPKTYGKEYFANLKGLPVVDTISGRPVWVNFIPTDVTNDNLPEGCKLEDEIFKIPDVWNEGKFHETTPGNYLLMTYGNENGKLDRAGCTIEVFKNSYTLNKGTPANPELFSVSKIPQIGQEPVIAYKHAKGERIAFMPAGTVIDTLEGLATVGEDQYVHINLSGDPYVKKLKKLTDSAPANKIARKLYENIAENIKKSPEELMGMFPAKNKNVINKITGFVFENLSNALRKL